MENNLKFIILDSSDTATDAFLDWMQDLLRRYPKPDLSEIDNLQNRINIELRKDTKPLIKY